jgi:aspartyl protease family protein
VRLVAADSRRAVLEYDGERVTLGLSNRVSTRFSAPEKRVVTIPRDDSGHYRVSGLINGQRARFLVDTGATMVTLSSAHARRLGIEWRRSERRGIFNTAMGQTEARFVRLDAVQVGEIRQQGVEAVVIDGDHPQMILLGMSFLGPLELTDSGGVLRLSQ